MVEAAPVEEKDNMTQKDAVTAAQQDVATVLRKDNLFSKFVSVIMVLTAIYIVVVISVNSVMRYVIKKDIYGVEELTALVAFWMYFAGAIYCGKRRAHISAEVVTLVFKSPRVLYGLSMFQRVATFAICLVFAWWGLDYFWWGITEGGRTNLWQIRMVWGHGPITVGFIAMLVYCIRDVIMLLKVKPSEYRPGIA